MGPPTVDWRHLAGWYRSRVGDARYRATVPLEQLARIYVWECAVEGVRPEGAWAQACLETGWFSWPYPPAHPSPVLPEYNNFAGMGATDDVGRRYPMRWSTASEGVRGQAQHLRAYATTEGGCDLHSPCVDDRFRLVRRGTGERWSQYGNGVWASSPNNYGGRILDLIAEVVAYRDAHP